MSWEKVYLKEILQIKNGKDHKKLKEGNYPVYGSGGIIRYVNQYLYDKKSVLLPRKGTLNNIQYVEKPFWTVDTCYYTEIDENKVNPYFLYRNLRQFDIEALNTGSAIPSMTFDKYYSIQIMIPSMENQNKIANILSAYDYLIENNQKQIKLLEEAAQRLYKEWFIDLRFPGYEDTEIIDGVPEGWKKQRISSLGEIITGKTPSTANEQYFGGNIPFVKIPDMHNCVYPIKTEVTLTAEGANTQKNKFIPKDSIMISCIATVGLVNIAVEPCQTNQQINSIIVNKEQDLYYVYSTMKRLKELLEGVGSNGATMTNVNKTKFGNLEVFYPTEELRKRYFEFCEPLFKKILTLSVSNRKLSQARDRLLPKLMSGELEV